MKMIPEEHFSILEDVKADLDTNKQVYGTLLAHGFCFCFVYTQYLQLEVMVRSEIGPVLSTCKRLSSFGDDSCLNSYRLWSGSNFIAM